MVLDDAYTAEKQLHGPNQVAADVQSGMELLRWQTSVEDWQEHLDREAGGGFAFLLSFGIMMTLFFAVVFWWTSRRDSMGLLDYALLSLTFSPIPFICARISDWSSRRSVRRLIDNPPAVLITSTGILFGDQAQMWRGPRYWLASVEEEPRYLMLHFERSGWRRSRKSLRIPVPARREGDISEFAGWARATTTRHNQRMR